MKTSLDLLLRWSVLVLGILCVVDKVAGEPKKGGSSSKGKKTSTAKKVGLGLAGAAVGAAGTAYVGHKLKKKTKKLRKGFGDDDDQLACWICGIPGFRKCPQGEYGIMVQRNMTDDDNNEFANRRRLPDDSDEDDEDELYDSYFGAYRTCPDRADSCFTLYSDHSREKVLIRDCFDEGLFGCYETVPGLRVPGFACFCRRDLCNHEPSIRWAPAVTFLLSHVAFQSLFVRALPTF